MVILSAVADAVATASAATAASETVTPKTWSYTDSRAVHETKTGPDAPVGARVVPRRRTTYFSVAP
ncbi:hypothetical protein [Alloactinosynnema sp. L-07]|nr:hypothetical protein [Alloactinosynnema sp. L-07]